MTLGRSLFAILAHAAIALGLYWPGMATAQLRLPSLNLPQGLGNPGLDGLVRPVGPLLDRVVPGQLDKLRLEGVSELLRRHPDVLETDTRGEPVVRSEILASSPTPALMAAALRLGFEVIREQRFELLGESLVVLRAPAGLSTGAALASLRGLDPQGAFDFNHVYLGGSSMALGGGTGANIGASAGAGADARAAASRGGVGLIDSGVASAHPVFAGTTIEQFGCGGTRHPAPHGTAVAALMVGRSDRFRGAAPGLRLFAADIYCDAPTGGSADKIAAALEWMARRQVGVINLSVVGPPNATLGRVVGAMLARGHLLVAAAGNDGPAAPPLYPASYPGVVGVSGVDPEGRPLPESARGPQVMFAAPGSQMVSAALGAPPYRQVRGSSFAAPIVSALLAQSLPQPERDAAARALAALARLAAGSNQATVSNATGHGVVGAALRMAPARFR
ncbi:S8 family serine peptidase [Massilia sp. H6]|uniref:S8 family serine peptidase n=1 Tax=Massilia sp. H6 TaxID=2970464 RepID=UPI00216867E8|nr:S8 family serine peptidase [Massilia sp. H6]UVW29808.1 S8 family serine peptidase [Massilia sp. H6]